MVRGICGFANTLVFSTLAGFSTDNVNISPVDLLLGYPSNVIIAWSERKGIDLKICVPLCILVIIGVEMFFQKKGPERQAKLCVIVLLICSDLSLVINNLV